MIKKLPNILLALLVIITGILAGCNKELTVEEINERAQQSMEKASSYRMELSGTQTQGDETQDMSAVIEFVAPDRMCIVQEDSTVSKSITIGRTEYIRYKGNDYWNVRKWPVGTLKVDTAKAYTEMLGSLEDLKQLADETIEGTPCLHYTGNIDMSVRGEEEKAKLDPDDVFYKDRLEALEVYDLWELAVEVWVGKNDYRIRKINQKQELTVPEEEYEQKYEYVNIEVTYLFSGYNTDIVIEAPASLSVKGVNLASSSTSSIGGTDMAHQHIKYEITVSNRGNETANNVRVFVDSEATNTGYRTFEGVTTNTPVNLGMDTDVTWKTEWEYDMTDTSKEELLKKMDTNVIRVTWEGQDGNEYEEILFTGSDYEP